MPANSMVIPSFYLALHDEQAFPEPEEFKPERWLDPNGLASKSTRNWLVFGAGPHKCVGEQYALYNMIIALANAVTLLDFEHVVTPESEQVQCVPGLESARGFDG